MDKETKHALIFGGAVAVVGIAYLLIHRNATSDAADSVTASAPTVSDFVAPSIGANPDDSGLRDLLAMINGSGDSNGGGDNAESLPQVSSNPPTQTADAPTSTPSTPTSTPSTPTTPTSTPSGGSYSYGGVSGYSGAGVTGYHPLEQSVL